MYLRKLGKLTSSIWRWNDPFLAFRFSNLSHDQKGRLQQEHIRFMFLKVLFAIMSTLASVFFLIITWGWRKPFQEDTPLNLVRRGKTSLEISILRVDEFISGANSQINSHLLSLLLWGVSRSSQLPTTLDLAQWSYTQGIIFVDSSVIISPQFVEYYWLSLPKVPRVNMSEVMDLKTQFLSLLMKLIIFVFLTQSSSS